VQFCCLVGTAHPTFRHSAVCRVGYAHLISKEISTRRQQNNNTTRRDTDIPSLSRPRRLEQPDGVPTLERENERHLIEGSVGLSAGLLWSALAKRCPGRGSDGCINRWPVPRINGAAFPTHRGDGALVWVAWKPKRRQARAGGLSSITSRPRENTRSREVPDCCRTPKEGSGPTSHLLCVLCGVVVNF